MEQDTSEEEEDAYDEEMNIHSNPQSNNDDEPVMNIHSCSMKNIESNPEKPEIIKVFYHDEEMNNQRNKPHLHNSPAVEIVPALNLNNYQSVEMASALKNLNLTDSNELSPSPSLSLSMDDEQEMKTLSTNRGHVVEHRRCVANMRCAIQRRNTTNNKGTERWTNSGNTLAMRKSCCFHKWTMWYIIRVKVGIITLPHNGVILNMLLR
ncbi:MAG: hypothetical protein NZ811_04960 [Gammaproteobacteria bacterium]|nr:hypothetical protein [Gammaproteobacteria bacterium]